MKSHLGTSRAVAIALLSAAALVGVSFGVAGSQGAGLPVPFLPYDIRNGESANVLHKGYQSGDVWTDTHRKFVHFGWWASVLENQGDGYVGLTGILSNEDPNPVAHGALQIATRYYPNAVTRLGDDSVLVAGVGSNEGVVIERWDLQYPSVMPFPVTDPATGVSSVQVAVPGRAAVSELYRAVPDPGHYVRAMCEVRSASGAVSKALVLWDNTGAVSVLDTDTGSHSVLASPTGGAYGPIPELGVHRLNRMKSMERTGVGYVYLLSYRSPGYAGGNFWPVVALIDADKDGQVDSHDIIDMSEWTAAGWGDESTYVDPMHD